MHVYTLKCINHVKLFGFIWMDLPDAWKYLLYNSAEFARDDEMINKIKSNIYESSLVYACNMQVAQRST